MCLPALDSDRLLTRDATMAIVATTMSGSPRWGEVVAVVVTGALHLICKPLGLQGVYIVGAILGWFGFVLVTARKRPNVLREWGFRSDTLKPAFAVSAAIFIPVVPRPRPAGRNLRHTIRRHVGRSEATPARR